MSSLEKQTDERFTEVDRLWSDREANPEALGCVGCRHRNVCGGLSIQASVFDCHDFCCEDPDNCTAVCEEKPREFADRVREVDGFTLENVPHAPSTPTIPLPSVVPVVYHGSRREGWFAPDAVCLRFYDAVSAISRHSGPTPLADRFGFAVGTPVILTGIGKDHAIEPWWSRTEAERAQILHRFKALGVELVTTPNFSLFANRPRPNDLHSMKRIAFTHEEVLRHGLPAALHVNGRTERDWERWAAYIAGRDEVTSLAFEFGTGAGRKGRIAWYVERFRELTEFVGRPLHLIVRGGRNLLPDFAAMFGEVTFLATTPFMKSMNRERAVRIDSGKIVWRDAPTHPGEPLDELLDNNWRFTQQLYQPMLAPAL